MNIPTRRFAIRSSADIGRTIAEARNERGWTQAELARQTGMERSYLARLEGGQSTIQVERILGLLRELGVSLSAGLEPRPHDDDDDEEDG